MNFDKSKSFPNIEEEVLKYWNEENIFQKQNELVQSEKLFKFYDGPPFATGLPHYGHLLAGTIKDVVCRYWISKGYKIDRRFGWDCHGLPVESEAQKDLGLNSVLDIQTYGVDKFNEYCRSLVLKYSKEWESTVSRSGRWVDFNNTYKTMDLNFMESVWNIFKKCFDLGLIYKDFRICPYSPKLGTTLSNFEVNQGFQEVTEQSVYVKFKNELNENILVWTTTPWSLYSNLAIAVNENLSYSFLKHNDETYIVCDSLSDKIFKEYELIKTISGKDLIGMSYKPIFEIPNQSENQYKILSSNHVTNSDGTGFVHIAPSFGEEDFEVGKKYNLGMFDPTDVNCNFTKDVKQFEGRFVKDCDKEIIHELRLSGNLFKIESIKHQYPFCYRTKSPLIYKAISTWYLNLNKIVKDGKTVKEWLNENNQEINWTPNHIKNGRFGSWIQNAKDWNISRNRFWGTPLPIWISEDGEMICVGSLKELETLTGESFDDIHSHKLINTIVKDGKVYTRTKEVFDCWFESGSMPYAQNHYPFSDKDLDDIFPGDFIAEGIDQTRGWFYTLNVLSSALFQKPAFKNVVVNGIVLAKDGKKMSKRDKNYPDPNDIFNRIGADSVRLYLLKSGASKADEVKFDEDSVKDITKSILLPLFNSLSFYKTYIELEKTEIEINNSFEELNYLDSWMLSELKDLIDFVDSEMQKYNFSNIISSIETFVDNLTNVYIRLSRERFWKSEFDLDKKNAYNVLKFTLEELSKVLKYFAPFFSEYIYKCLNDSSVHLQQFSTFEFEKDDSKISQMKLFKDIIELGRTYRSKNNLKLRQPLNSITICLKETLSSEILELIKSELNVKNVIVENDILKYNTITLKLNFKHLKEFSSDALKDLKGISFNEDEKIKVFLGESIFKNGYELNEENLILEVSKKDKTLESNNNITLFFDSNITEELYKEMLSNEFKTLVQKIRKDSGFDISDRVLIKVKSNEILENDIKTFKQKLEQILLGEIVFEDCDNEYEIEGSRIYITLERNLI